MATSNATPIRYIWPHVTPCPKCKSTMYAGLRSDGKLSQRRCRSCGTLWKVEATHQESAPRVPGDSGRIEACAAPAYAGSSKQTR